MSPFSFRRLKKRSQFCRRPEYSIFKELWAGGSNALRRGKQSQLRRRIMSAPGHENGDTAGHLSLRIWLTGARNVPIFFSPFEKTKPILPPPRIFNFQGAVGRGFERLAARKTEPIEAKNHVCAWA
jgi:hypothetical protein